MSEKIILWGEEEWISSAWKDAESFVRSGDVQILGAAFRKPAVPDRKQFCSLPVLSGGSPEWEQATGVVVCTQYFTEKMIREAKTAGIPRERMIPGDLLRMDGFSFGRYRKLAESRPTILSNSCWAGLTYHFFGLPFRSPTINLFIVEDEYLEFLENLDRMLEEEPVFDGTEYNQEEDLHYPVYRIGNVRLHMNHCADPALGLRQWKERRTRVNRDNLIVMMYAESEQAAARFDMLPFPHKFCFVPFRTDLESAVPVNNGNIPLVNYVNSCADGTRWLYDPWKIVEEGRVCLLPEDAQVKLDAYREMRERVESAEYVLLYGAWALGQKAFGWVSAFLPEKMLGFSVTDMEGNPPEKEGFPVRTLWDWKAYLEQKKISQEDVLIVMALNPMYYHQLERSLRKAGFGRILQLEELEAYCCGRDSNF